MVQRPRILVADDQYHIRKIMGIILGSEYELIFAENGVEALEKIRTQEIDLVVTDFRMPYMNGLELIRAIQHEKPELSFILMSAYWNDLLRDREHAGAVYVVQKPFQVAAVTRIIRKLLAQRK
ncbi:MAG: response regulator [Candidatus Poribacteria bacterium]|nr:response regulator [Candidatus Poribacteria bacterium]